MACNVDFDDLLRQSGGEERLKNAAKQAFETVQSGQQDDIIDLFLDGKTFNDYFEGDAGFANNIAGLLDLSIAATSQTIEDIPGSGHALAESLKGVNALNAAESFKGAYDNVEEFQDIGGLAGGLLGLVGAAETAGKALSGAGEILSVTVVGALPGANLKMLGTMLETIGADLKKEALQIAEMLKNTLDGKAGGFNLPGVDLNDPNCRKKVQEAIDEINEVWAPVEKKNEEHEDNIEDNPAAQEAVTPGTTPKPNKVIDPLAIDLDGDGVELTPLDDPKVYFDYEDSGASFSTAWISPDDGIVVKDLNGNGIVDSAEEFFGDSTTDAFADLETYDYNLDGKIDYKDAIWADMRVWRDLNQNGTTEEGELVSMTDAGVASISLTRDETEFTSAGNTIAGAGSYTRTDGQLGEAWAVFFNVSTADTQIELPPGFSFDLDVFKLPELRGSGYVPDLSVAMTLDPALKGLVESLARDAASISGAELRSRFEQIFKLWSETSDTTERLSIVELFAGGEINYFHHNPIDIAWSFTTDVREEFDYQTMLDAKLLRFTLQLPAFDMQDSKTSEDWQETTSSPFFSLTSMGYNPNTDVVSGWIGLPIVRIATALPEDRIAAFEQIDQVMPVLKSLRQDYYESKDVFWFPDIKGSDFKYDLKTQIDDTFDDPMLADFAYYRTLVSTVAEGTADDEIFDIQKTKYLTETGRDYTYFFGKEGDDTFYSRPYIGPLDPLRPEWLQQTGKQQETVILYRSGDGNDIIDLSEANGKHIVYLPDIDSVDGTFAVAPTGSGDALLTFSGGGSILFRDIGNIDRGAVEIRFADGVTLTDDDVRLQFTDFDDVIVGSSRFDTLFGGLGDDELRGEVNDDTYIYRKGDGRDVIIDPWFSKLEDVLVLQGISRSDVTFSRIGGSDLQIDFAGSPGDRITIIDQFTKRAVLDNRPGPTISEVRFDDDTVMLAGDIGAAAFEAEVGEGNDTVEGTATWDTLFFSNGDDTLSGNGGTDTYIRRTGTLGNDVINEDGSASQDDFLVLEGVTPDQVALSRNGNNVILTFQNGTLKIIGQLASGAVDRIEEIRFADGSVWTDLDIAEMLFPVSGSGANITGTAGNETLNGSAADERIDGLAGDDVLRGRAGSDLYVYGAGYGDDLLIEAGEFSSRSIDRLELLGLTPDDVTFTRIPGNELLITIDATGETLTVQNHFSSSKNAVEFVHFADGTIWGPAEIQEAAHWRGTDVDETISGSGDDDTIEGGLGNDLLKGAGGNDTYVFSQGDGAETIQDGVGSNSLRLKGIGAAEIELWRDGSGTGNDGILSYGQNGDTIRLVNQFNDNVDLRPIETIVLDAGPALAIDGLQQVSRVRGSDGNDTVRGTPDADFIDGLEGDDNYLSSTGDDVYYWASGRGFDTIRDFGDGEAENAVRIGGLTLDELEFGRVVGSQDLVITNLATGETLTIVDQFDDPSGERIYGVERIELDDGTVLSRGDILELAPIRGTPGDDALGGGRGTDSYAWGRGQGNDVIDDGGRYEQPDLLILEDLLPGDVAFRRAGGFTGRDGYDLAIDILDTGETLTLIDQLKPHRTSFGNDIHTILFDDGTRMPTAGFAAALPFGGTAADDQLFGDAQNNILLGGAGDDTLSGEEGADTYRWSSGDGNDLILEQKVEVLPGGGGEEGGGDEGGDGGPVQVIEIALESPGDVLELTGVTADRVSFARASDKPGDLIVTILPPVTASTGPIETIRIAHQFEGAFAGVEEIRTDDAVFDNGMIMAAVGGTDATGTSADDLMTGTWGADDFTPGTGDDTVETFGGADTIRIGEGSGIDTVLGFAGGPLGTRFILPAGIFATFDELIAAAVQNGPDVFIDFGNGNGIILTEILISDIDPENFGFNRGPIQGTERSEGLAGTLNDDLILAGAGDDVIAGRAGDDTMHGEDGDDLITPGAGDDFTDGGEGEDVAYFSGKSTDYLIDIGSDQSIVEDLDASDGDDGRDTLSNVEYAVFEGDGKLIPLVNVAPVAASEGNSVAGDEDSRITGQIPAAKDENGHGPLTYALAAGPVDGLILNADGSFEFLPAADFHGTVEFSYVVSDPLGATSDPQNFTIEVLPVNDAPVIVSDGSFMVAENTTVVGNVVASDNDSADLAFSIVGGADADVFNMAADGTFEFKSAPDFEAPEDSDCDNVYEVEVRVSDGSLFAEELFTVTVTDVDDVPTSNEIVGTDGSDYLVGTDEADIIRGSAGIYDRMRGGADADQFIFGNEARNGLRERDLILDYEVGIDEIVLEGDAVVATLRSISSGAVIYLEGDRDAIYVRGDGVTASNLTIIDSDSLNGI